MNHSVCDIAVGMILGYALARGISHAHQDSPLSEGADAMSEEHTRQASAAMRRGEQGGGGAGMQSAR
ncbi:MAG TPA: hypothetical protein PJ986_01590 [Gammaproteobacteria bacterium]|nr:hypothetical protein [Gammaproteobacteria bacterium]